MDIVKKARVLKPRTVNQIPSDILNNDDLNNAIAKLPSNYSFELHKTIHQLQKHKSTRVALQFPEGLLMYACLISDIIESFANVETLIMGDVTYGACCIDDYTARALACDFMVHYGHSCLVPVTTTLIKTLYVFVDIGIDVSHFVESLKVNFGNDKEVGFEGYSEKKTLALTAKAALEDTFTVIVPQSKPLSQGEILGCTAPKVTVDLIIYIGDGRFHLEAMMISNPTIDTYKYDPYTKKLTVEKYDQSRMIATRKQQIGCLKVARSVGVILGTLGRQGSTTVLDTLERHGKQYTIILLSEIYPAKLAKMELDCYVQIACPRLSIDWGTFFQRPLLTPFEMMVGLGEAELKGDTYPMDFYAKDSLGNWTPNHQPPSILNR